MRTNRPRRESLRWIVILSAVLSIGIAAFARSRSLAEDGGAARHDAGATYAEALARAQGARDELERMTAAIHALLAGSLDPQVDPQTLFGLPLSGRLAAELEAARLRIALSAQSADVDAGVVDEQLGEARAALDRARLQFYELAPERREALLAQHASKREKRLLEGGDGAARNASRLAEERERALAAARQARSDAERLMSEEQARLLSIEQEQGELASKLSRQREELGARRESVQRLERRARELREAGSSAAVDGFYDLLRSSLSEARQQLDGALDALADPPPVPDAKRGRLLALPPELDTRAVDEARERVARGAETLRNTEIDLLEDTAAELIDEVDRLNRERLSLLDLLSNEKRTAITGFTLAAFEQALDELGHLTLVLRYHRHVTSRWLAAPGALTAHDPANRTKLGEAISAAVLLMARLAFVLLLFVWWRKQSAKVLASIREYLEREDRDRRRAGHSPLTSAVRFVEQIRVPLGRVALVLLIGWLLPAGAKRLVEVQLLFAIALWIWGGALAVRVVDALAGSHRGDVTAALRLRSLTLVGRVVVAYGLVLAISAQLVGRGTIYHWVLFTCWFASIPVFLVLVRWWREIVFEKIDAVRRKSVFDEWILENRHGYRSFVAASFGGVYLFTRGFVRTARVFVSSFDLSRHLLAYLFRREIDRLTGENAQRALHPLDPAVFRELGPDVGSKEMVRTAEDEAFARIVTASAEGRGSVIAIVGARGAGKSSALARLAQRAKNATPLTLGEIACSVRGLATSEGASALPQLAAHREQSESPGMLLVDDAEQLIMPAHGGLAAFDEVLATARGHSGRTTWVFAFDEAAWTYLRCARSPRPLFDQIIVLAPFREAQIAELLQQRTRQAEIQPSFERLIDRLRPYADEHHRAEILQERALGYYRLIWNFAGGNPGVALHMWRLSLEVDDQGQPLVHPFKAFDMQDLEQLPEAAIFALRTVLTLCSATAEEVGRVTQFSPRDVADALAYAVARGYLTEENGRYRVTWTWLRPITVHLRRRQILVPA